MYLKNLSISNYGSIDRLDIKAQFDENGNPFPIVLIGENGSGKTLAIANIIDALIEIKRNTFGNSLQEVASDKFFKIGSHKYIKFGQTYSRIYSEFSHNEQTLKYYDIMSNNPTDDINSGRIYAQELVNVEEFKVNGYSRKTIGRLNIKNYNEFVLLYFPTDRYYLPYWYNRDNYNKLSYDVDSDVNRAKTNLIKIDLLSNIKDWVTDIYLEKVSQQIQMPNNAGLPSGLRGRMVQVMLPTDMQNLIIRIFSAIKGRQIALNSQTNRKNRSVGFSNIYDIDQLSEGEMSLFSIALSIVREWDITHNNIDINQIEGIVVIDEADLGLHIDYAYRALPQLMKFFPKVQFILTAHSPFLLAGLYNEYGRNLSVISMPSGLILDNINDYCELEKAEALIKSISKVDEQLEEKKKELETLMRHMKDEQGKIYVYTEGPTDAILINKAIEKLGVNDLNLIVNAVNCTANKKGNEELCKFLESLSSNQVNNNIVIGVFDRDVAQKVKDVNGNQIELKEQVYANLGNNTYAFILPVPHDREQEDQISIEHYFTDEEIKTCNELGQRLFIGNEFDKVGNHLTGDYHYHYIEKMYETIKIIEHETRKYVTDKKGDGDYSLSKMHFAEAIRDERAGFTNFDFSEFNKIFDIIKEIIKEARGD